MTSRRQMLRSSAGVGVFSFLGSLTGVLIEVSIAAHLGLSRASDTFYAAFTIPYLLTNILKATGQFSLVPFFSSLDAAHSREQLGRGFSYVLNFVLLGGCGLAGAGALAAPWLIAGLAPGFTHSESVLAAELCRWLFLILVPAGVTEVLRSFLFSQRRFAFAASGNLFRNATVVASILLGFHRYRYSSIILGYMLGYVIQLVVLAARVVMVCPVRYSLALTGSGEAFRHLHGAARAQMASAAQSQVRVVVERIIASFLPPGTLTALHYGLKIMATLSELMAGSIGTVVLPTLSRAFARLAKEEGQFAFQAAIEISLTVLGPVMVFCLMLSHAIMRLLFERGHFTPQATALMGPIFFFYSLSIAFYMAQRAVVIYLFSRHEHGVFIRLVTLYYGVNILFDLVFVGVFHWELAGIPLALFAGLATFLAAAWARNAGEIRQSVHRRLGAYFAKTSVGAGLTALAIWLVMLRMPVPVTGLENFVFLFSTCSAGLFVFFGTLIVLKALKVSQISALWRRAES